MNIDTEQILITKNDLEILRVYLLEIEPSRKGPKHDRWGEIWDGISTWWDKDIRIVSIPCYQILSGGKPL